MLWCTQITSEKPRIKEIVKKYFQHFSWVQIHGRMDDKWSKLTPKAWTSVRRLHESLRRGPSNENRNSTWRSNPPKSTAIDCRQWRNETYGSHNARSTTEWIEINHFLRRPDQNEDKNLVNTSPKTNDHEPWQLEMKRVTTIAQYKRSRSTAKLYFQLRHRETRAKQLCCKL